MTSGVKPEKPRLCFISKGATSFTACDARYPAQHGSAPAARCLVNDVQRYAEAPHGGMFVLLISGAISPVTSYIIAIAAGTLLLGVLYSLLKRPDAPS